MPFYQCLVPAGSLSTSTRATLAEAITDVHCNVTGAPRGFVNVLFVEYDPAAYFTAGKPNNPSVINAVSAPVEIARRGRDCSPSCRTPGCRSRAKTSARC